MATQTNWCGSQTPFYHPFPPLNEKSASYGPPFVFTESNAANFSRGWVTALGCGQCGQCASGEVPLWHLTFCEAFMIDKGGSHGDHPRVPPPRAHRTKRDLGTPGGSLIGRFCGLADFAATGGSKPGAPVPLCTQPTPRQLRAPAGQNKRKAELAHTPPPVQRTTSCAYY